MLNPFDPGYYGSDDLRRFGFKAVGEDVQIARNCTIIGLERIRIGSNIRIDGYSTLIAPLGGYIQLGDYVTVSAYCLLGGRGGIELHDFAGLSQGVKVYSASDDYSGCAMTGHVVPPEFTDPQVARTVIGRHTVIGSGAVILPGAHVQEGTAVGALSMVTHRTRPWTIVSGVPAKKVGPRHQNVLELERQLGQGAANNPCPGPPEVSPSLIRFSNGKADARSVAA